MADETVIYGGFDIAPVLERRHREYLTAFCGIRHVRRDVASLAGVADPVREAAGLPIGDMGEFVIVGEERYDSPQVLDYNMPPGEQPGVYCCWIPSEDGEQLLWSPNTSFYEHEGWLAYLVKTFFTPWGYAVSGAARFQGEAADDAGWIVAEAGSVRIEPLAPPAPRVPAKPYALMPGEGVPGFDGSVKAGRVATGGVLTVIESHTEGGALLHVHTREDEFLYVLQGAITVRCGAETHVLPAGGFVFLPRGVPHGWDVVGSEAVVQMVTVPAMLEEFLQEFHAASDPAGRTEVASRYGISFLPTDEHE